MPRFLFKLVTALFLVASLGACAQGARTSAMIAPVAENNILPANDPLVNSSKIGQVVGGTETSPLWKSEISGRAFREALEESLRLSTILGDDSAPLTIDVKLLSVEQPFLGASMTVTTSVQYTVTNSKGAIIFDDIISRCRGAHHRVPFFRVFRGPPCTPIDPTVATNSVRTMSVRISGFPAGFTVCATMAACSSSTYAITTE